MISSTSNKQVGKLARLRKRALREKDRRFLVEGAQAASEAVAAGVVELLVHAPAAAAGSLLSKAREAGVRDLAVSERVMAHITSTVTPQPVLAVSRFVDVPLREAFTTPGLVPVLCAVRDPGNAGTVLRSADAAGADAIVFTDSSVDVYNPKTVRASAGSLFHLPVVRGVPVEEAVRLMRDRGAQVIAAAADGESTVYEADLSGPTAVLFGNEAWGLSAEVRNLADRSVRLPIRGSAESLNLAAAAALFLFEAARQRETRAGSLVTAISGASHDIRSSLTALKGFGSTLAAMWDRIDDEMRRSMVQGMSVDAERVGALLRMMIDAARLEEGRFRAVPERHDVSEALRWLERVVGGGGDQPEIRWDGSGEAYVDLERLQAILLTLWQAALWWGDEPVVAMGVEQEDGGAVIEVRRGGGRTTPEEIREGFELPRRGGGGKIGLWLASRLAEAQGIRLSWEAGDGVLFRMVLPSSSGP